MRTFFLTTVLVVACLVLLNSLPLAAQDTSLYRGFRFDTTFLVGGYDNSFTNLRYLTDTLHFNFTRTYGGPFRITGSWLVTTPSDTAWIAGLAGERDRWYARQEVKRWREIYDTHLKVIHAFSEIRELAKACEVSEAFYTHDPAYAHNSSFAWNAGVLGTLTSDTLIGGYARAARVDSVSPPTLTLVAGGMIYANEGLVLSSIHNLLSVAGVNNYADSTGWFSAGVALKIEDADIGQNVGDNDELARMVLYVRDTAGQSGPSDCHCQFFRKFDSVKITKALYNATPDYARGKAFRDIIRTFKFPNDTNVATGNSSRKNVLYHPSSGIVFNGDPACDSSTCAQKLQQLRDSGLVPASTVMLTAAPYASDFYFNLYTTRRVPLKFAGGRISSLVFTQVLRGDADTLMRYIAREFYADNALDSLLYRFEITDETRLSRFKPQGMITAKFQNILLSKRPSETRGFWANPQEATRFMRVNTGDLDTSDVRIVHMMANQQYSFGAIPTDSVVIIPMPAFYANPDSMDTRALYSYWRARRVMHDTTVTDSIWRVRPGDSVASWFVAHDVMGSSYADTAPRGIAYNTESDYNLFTDRARQLSSGKLALLDDNIRTARSTFSSTGVPSYPVYAVVQVQGFTEPIGQSDWPKYWTAWAIPYPTYITMHSWMTIASGMDGMIFGDFAFDGTGEFGIRHWVTGEHSFNYYDSMSVHDPIQGVDTLTKQWLFPRMWYGFLGRSGALESVMDEFHNRVLPVYCTLNRQNVVRRNLRDDSATVSDITMLAWAGVAKVKRYDRGTGGVYLDTLNGQSRVIPLPTSESDLVVSWHRPLRAGDSSQYLTIINLRQWPVDTLQYGGRYQYWAPSGAATRGFGARDVRRPMVALRNTSPMIADSCVVEQVGHEGDFRVRAAYGDTILLPFLDPGAGMMIRVVPISRAVSRYGVAYNNSQRVENPSLDTLARPRIAVYERDSIIYMRLNHRNGMWSAEIRVSDSADADSASRAWCLNPAVAVVRNGSSALVTWERRHNSVAGSSRSSIRARYYCAFPDTGALPPNTVFTISDTLKLGNDSLRTHAVIGLDSGYVVAWGTPYNGIELAAIRDTVFNSGNYSNYISLSGTRVRAGNVSVKRLGQSPVNLDSLSVFPTLAYVRNRQSVFFSQTHDVYLSWQQGGGASGVGPFIFFTPVGIKFTPGQKPTIVATAAIEHVSRDLPGCRFIHPCIAADTLRVGVTFEAVEQMSWKGMFNSPSTHVVVLRFRDSVTTGGQILLRWKTPAYAWSNGNGIYQFPSVVQFPNVPRTTLRSAVPGGLTWYAPDATGDSKVMLYQYRQRGLDSSLRGVDPTMVRSPFTRLSTAYSTSGVFYREPDKNRDTATSPFGYSSLYYGAHLENTPSVPSALFVNSTPQGGAIFANFVLRQTAYDHSSCDIPAIIGGLVIRNPIDPGDDGYWIPIGIKFVTGLPPSFFAEPDSGNTVVDTITKISTVVRTGEFHAPSGGVTIQWGIQGSSQLGTWLQNAPNDSLLNIPANIVASLQLVRASNNSVLWTSDTVSALSLMSPDPVGFETDIAADSLAGVDSLVYVRMVVYAPINLDYTMSTGFQFIEDPVNYFPKRVRRSNGDESLGEAMLSLSVHPNPVNDRITTVVVQSPFGDEATSLALYDIRGTLLYDLGPVVLKDGYGSGQLDVSRLTSGVYSLVIRQKARIASTKLTVIR